MVLTFKDEILVTDNSSEKYPGIPCGTVFYAVESGSVCDCLNES